MYKFVPPQKAVGSSHMFTTETRDWYCTPLRRQRSRDQQSPSLYSFRCISSLAQMD